MSTQQIILTIFITLFLNITPATATLIDRGGGLIYDTDLNITWLQDVSYAKTSGYDADGLMTWYEAVNYADNLVYGGYNDWRLPATLQPDPTCSNQDAGWGISWGLGCKGGELGHLYYNELLNPAGGPLVNTGPFINILHVTDWTETDIIRGDTNDAWCFGIDIGGQGACSKSSYGRAWAVRNGDSHPVAEPSTLLLLTSGLAGLVAWKRKQICNLNN